MPLYRTMITYTTLWTLADVIEQKYISKKVKHDVKKTARITTVGTFVVAPLVFNWIRLADKLWPGKRLKTVITKVVVEQITFAPVSITCFYGATCLLEGKNFRDEMKAKCLITWRTGVCFWPFIQMFNFGVVQPQYRPLVVGCGSFIWSLFLCFMKEDKKDLLPIGSMDSNNDSIQIIEKPR